MRRHWLVKSEPHAFSFGDLGRQPGRTAVWDGVRNYQARNFLRQMREGDGVVFYHSSVKTPAAVGLAVVVREAYPDPTQFDPASEHFDPGSPADAPRWSAVDLRQDAAFAREVTLAEMRATPRLQDLMLLKRGSRLSVIPLTDREWRTIVALSRGPVLARRSIKTRRTRK